MKVAIVPYRNRPVALSRLLPNLHSFDRVIVCEQEPTTPFNRGWLKNVGFLLSGATGTDMVYFHDVDTLPGPRFVGYKSSAFVEHLYGHTHTLGGIVGMPAHLFQTANGFPNNHAQWGGEDRVLYDALQPYVRRQHWVARFSDCTQVYEIDEAGRVEDMRDFRQRVLTASTRASKPVPVDLCGELPFTDWRVICQLPTAERHIWHVVVEKPKKTVKL